jgi:polyisoprenoid-binding protein YceI
MKHAFYTTLAILVLLTSFASAQTKYTIKSQKIEVVGTSNLHDWTATVGKVSGSTDFKVDNNAIVGITSAVVDIDANSLVGSKGSIMDNKIKDTFESEKYPRIKFALAKVNSIQTAGNVSTINIVGNVTIRTVTIPVEFVVKATTLPNGDIEVRSSKKLKMTDFSLKPPTAMLGALKTANDVTVNIYFVLKK